MSIVLHCILRDKINILKELLQRFVRLLIHLVLNVGEIHWPFDNVTVIRGSHLSTVFGINHSSERIDSAEVVKFHIPKRVEDWFIESVKSIPRSF